MEQSNYLEEPPRFSLCVSVQSKLQDLIEGYLDVLTAESIRAHLAVCYFCQKEYSDLQQTIRLIETLPYAQTSVNFEQEIMAAIDRQSGGRTPSVADAARQAELDTGKRLNKQTQWAQRISDWMRKRSNTFLLISFSAPLLTHCART